MKLLNCLNQVADFHKTFQHPVLESPRIPAKERCDLRLALLREEVEELKEAIDKVDIVGVADALVDIQYVLSGAVLEFGLGDKFPDLFDEVHRSNMSKACKNLKEVDETIELNAKKGVLCYSKIVRGKWLIFRSSDNKTIKSINYSPANLKSILE